MIAFDCAKFLILIMVFVYKKECCCERVIYNKILKVRLNIYNDGVIVSTQSAGRTYFLLPVHFIMHLRVDLNEFHEAIPRLYIKRLFPCTKTTFQTAKRRRSLPKVKYRAIFRLEVCIYALIQ